MPCAIRAPSAARESGSLVISAVPPRFQAHNASCSAVADASARGSPAYQNIHDKRAETIAILTGKKYNERTSNAEHDITGESIRVA